MFVFLQPQQGVYNVQEKSGIVWYSQKMMKFPIIRPYITKDSEKEVIRVLRSGWLTQGRYVDSLEKSLKAYSGSKYAFLLNSATSGLIAAVMALGLKQKDEVICPSFTFPATSNAVMLGGATPVFCDIGPRSFNISVEKIERSITRKTRAIMPVSEFGLPADMKDIMSIARKHGLSVIEDAACALGAKIGDKKIGSFGDMGVFSFHPRKIVTSGEGGCVVTSSAALARTIKFLRNQGNYDNRFIGYGYNFRMSDIQASILAGQVGMIEDIIKKRISLAENYNRLLKGLQDKGLLTVPDHPEGYRHTYQSYVIMLSGKIDRDRLARILMKKGIETKFGTYCVPVLDFYRKNFKIPKDRYKNAYFAYKHSLTLPLYHTLKESDQVFIADSITKAIMAGPDA